jgi:hypothetical protein
LYSSLSSIKFYENDIKPIILKECISKHAAELYIPLSQVSESSKALWEKLSNKAGYDPKVATDRDADMESISTNSSPETFKIKNCYGET